MKKSLVFLALALFMVLLVGSVGGFPGIDEIKDQEEKSRELAALGEQKKEKEKELEELPEDITSGDFDFSIWEKTKDFTSGVVSWPIENVFYPVIGKKVTWYEVFGSFGYFLFVGFFGAGIALIVLGVLTATGVMESVLLNKIFMLNTERISVISHIKKVALLSAIFGFFYGIVMVIPILNRFIEIITLQIFTHLLGFFGEFFARIVLLALVLILIFFLPDIVRGYIHAKEKAKGNKLLRKAALKAAMEDVKLEQAIKDAGIN